MIYVITHQTADRQQAEAIRTMLPIAIISDYLLAPGLAPGERIVITRPRVADR